MNSKTFPLFSRVLILAAACLGSVTLAAADAPAVNSPTTAPGYSTTPTPGSTSDSVRMGVQMTEVGLMRALLLLDESALEHEAMIAQRLSDVDFRVFPSATAITGRLTAEHPGFTDLAGYFAARAKEAKADLLVYAKVDSREKKRFDDFQLHEAEATVQIYSPMSGELLATEQVRATGTRQVDAVEARRSAREAAVNAATKAVIVKGLQKAHKLIVHTATITGVQSSNHLLTILDYMAKLQGVYHVRQVSYDLASKRAVIEIIGSPQTATFWRAHLEKLPKAQEIDWDYVERKEAQKHYPSWWKSE